jgi:hypothetical protein
MEEDTCELGQEKITSCFEVLLKRNGIVVNSCQSFKKERMMINHKPNNYD